MIWIIAISIAYYGVKGMGFMLLTGGGDHVVGPDNTMIGDNNNLGAALVPCVPLLNYLRLSSLRSLVRVPTLLAMASTGLAVIGTYSRGGLFGLGITTVWMWLRSRHKVFLFLLVGVIAIALPFLVPQKWFQRMSTISAYATEDSFEERVESWKVATRIALDRPFTGGGFNVQEEDNVFRHYNTDGKQKVGRAAHSIYFQVLSDHGFIGLTLYLLIIGATFLNLRDVIRGARDRDDLHWGG